MSNPTHTNTITQEELDTLCLALEKAHRMLSEEGFNKKSMVLITMGRNLLRSRFNVQRIKCDIPNDTKVFYKHDSLNDELAGVLKSFVQQAESSGQHDDVLEEAKQALHRYEQERGGK